MNRRQRAAQVLDRLRVRIPAPQTELHYRTEFELLVAVVLSAQCTDARVNQVTPALFAAYPTPAAMASATAEEIFPYIRSVSYPNNKAKALASLSRSLVERFGGQVPGTVEALMTLQGVGRKTALVLVSVLFDTPAIAVDTHVFRVANRLGLVKDAPTPRAVEEGLNAVLPARDWAEAHHLLILHGRYTCTARTPACDRCSLTDLCAYHATLRTLPAPLTGLDKKQGAYFCAKKQTYFDTPTTKIDRDGVEQVACPTCGSIDVYLTKSGATTRRVKDFRIG